MKFLFHLVALVAIIVKQGNSVQLPVHQGGEGLSSIHISFHPDPQINHWPREDLTDIDDVFCPPNVNATFIFNNTFFKLQLKVSPIKPNRVPVLIGDGNGVKIYKRHSTKSSPIVCFYQAPLQAATFVFEAKPNNRISATGSFVTNHGKFTVASTDELPDGNYDIYKLSEAGSALTHPSKRNFEDYQAIRGMAQANYVEGLAVIDYKIYQRWYEYSKKTTPGNVAENTMEFLKYYYAYIFNEMDNMYKSIVSTEISISVYLVGYYIATKPSEAKFCEDHKTSTGINIDVLMDAFGEFLDTTNFGVKYDHAFLFTGYDMYGLNENNKPDKNVAGYAPLGGICNPGEGLSLSEDWGQFEGAGTAAHELGHNLGADHDGSGNDCKPEKQFIMSAIEDSSNKNYIRNSHHFSKCSVQAFEKKIKDMNSHGKNCLLNVPKIYDKDEYLNMLKLEPGQKFTLDQLCFVAFGNNSEYCGGTVSLASVCQEMSCRNPVTRKCTEVTAAVEASQCGDQKWCHNEVCVSNSAAPALLECQYGDYGAQIQLDANTAVYCNQYIANDKTICYSQEDKDMCCASCAKYYNPNYPGCEYGDQADWCSTMDRADACGANADVCCQTCATGVSSPSITTRSSTAPTASPTTTSTTKTGVSSSSTGEHTTSLKTSTTSNSNCVDEPWCDIKNAADCYGLDDLCCASCSMYATGIIGCEYGDSEDRCVDIQSSECYDYNYTNAVCCETCDRFYTGIEGCEYGDEIQGCTQDQLTQEYCDMNGALCCDTCKQFNSGEKRMLESSLDKLLEYITGFLHKEQKVKKVVPDARRRIRN